jgi:N-acetylglucosaminyl-diphospho-decaprenol L-rhamnosyltransferase
VIVTWNSADAIERCLAALPAASGRLRWEAIVHDNLSGDDTVEKVTSSPSAVRLIAADSNLGFAGGINSAVAAAGGRHLLLLNPDCELDPGALEVLVGYLDANPSAGAVAPLLIGEDGEVQRDFQLRRLPTLARLAGEILLVGKLFPSSAVIADFRCRDLDITSPGPVEQPAAAALLIRREVLERVGALDESFFPAWFEDVDLCRRFAGEGIRIDLVPAARALHRGGASLDHIPFREFTAIWYRNLFRYVQKWFTPGETELVRWMVIGGMILRIGAVAVGLSKTTSRREAIAAYAAVIRDAFGRWDASR